MSTFRTKIRHYYIYAVYHRGDVEDTIYIWRTYAKDPRACYYSHLRGACRWTRDDYGHDQGHVVPTFLILESIDCTGSDAYRHVLAWCEYFAANGYIILNAPKTTDQAALLNPRSQEIYETVCAPYTVESVLARDIPVIPQEVTIIPTLAGSPKNAKLTITAPPDVVDEFRRWTKANDWTYGDALRHLLLGNNSIGSDALYATLEQDLAHARAQCEVLRDRIADKADRQKTRQETGRQRCIRWAAVIRGMLREILPAKPDQPLPGRPIPHLTFRRGKNAGAFQHFTGPTEDGWSIITLDVIVYGSGHVPYRYICGHTTDGTPIRLRSYQREDTVGVPYRGNPYLREGSQWIMGYTISQDGAADLIAAIPVAAIPARQSSVPRSLSAPTQQTDRSLDAIIAGITNRKPSK